MTTRSSYGPNASSQMTAAWVGPKAAYAGMNTSGVQVQGQETWYHVSLYLPQGKDCFTSTGTPDLTEAVRDCWFPTTGRWNVLIEWHDDNHTWTYGANSTYMGVLSDYPTASGTVGQNPHLVLVVRGGSSSVPTEREVELSDPLMVNHWYSITFHFVWSASSTSGLAEWWVDGKPRFSQHVATLYTNPDGTASYNTFGIYNYHLAAGWNNTSRFSDVAIGPTRDAVNG